MGLSSKIRKQFILDSGKIKAVKRIIKAKTDTEAVDKALDLVIENEKIERILASMRGKGKISDVYHRVSR